MWNNRERDMRAVKPGAAKLAARGFPDCRWLIAFVQALVRYTDFRAQERLLTCSLPRSQHHFKVVTIWRLRDEPTRRSTQEAILQRDLP